ncbi:MAG: hypothetical protein FJY20_01890 [Bacteroidetes bacterium]|nr:hypothetical protein [Bacteroidota bacterium]
MKNAVMPKTVQLSEETKQQLPAEVKETPADQACVIGSKKLTAADIWRLHRNGRSASDMIRKWDLN